MADTVDNNNKVQSPPFSWKTFGDRDFLVNNTTGATTFVPKEQSALTSGLQTGSQVVSALSSGVDAYTGWKSLGLADDTFDFTVEATNKDIANQAKLLNNEIINANEVGLALGGGVLTPEQIAASRKAATERLVDGSPIPTQRT